VTRWQLLHLPVRFGEERWPRYRVRHGVIDWEDGRLTHLVIGWGWPRWPSLKIGPGVTLGTHEVWAADAARVEWRPPEAWRALRESDWQGRPVLDNAGRVVARVADAEFNPETGDLVGVWLSRGVIADMWLGMRQVDPGFLRHRHGRIEIHAVGHSPADEGDER
jgi:sporulation protein YlmC with PRC-barrel domain